MTIGKISLLLSFWGLLVLSTESLHTDNTIFKPSIVEFEDLFVQSSTVSTTITNILVTYGILQIAGIPKFAQLKQVAMQSLSLCLASENESTRIAKPMSDGSLRLTSQSASIHGQPGEMSSRCGEASSKLRALIDATTRQLFLALDKASLDTNRKQEQVMAPYKSYDDVMRSGEHLEHLHAFYSAKGDTTQEKVSNDEVTMDFHTDSGLLIAMTTGYYSREAPSEGSGLYIQLPTGVKARAVVEDDALIIMVGDGGARWLAPVCGAPFRAVPHALVAGLRAGSESTRSWYGKMYLPPSDAIVPQEGISFARYQQIQSRGIAAASAESRGAVVDYSSFLPSACGGDTGRYLLASSTTCDVGGVPGHEGIMCWMTCMSVGDLPCGQSAECVNPATGEISDGNTVTCHSCHPQCKVEQPVLSAANLTVSAAKRGYCFGPGVVMYMQGFTSLAVSGSGSTACLNFLFLGWTLDSGAKFFVACAASLLMGVLVHLLTKTRLQLGQWLKPGSYKYNSVALGIHSLQVLLGYFLMLVAMTYSVELFCMVVLGLSIGYGAFNLHLLPDSENTDPCCSGGDTYDSDDRAGEKTPISTRSGLGGVSMVYMQAATNDNL